MTDLTKAKKASKVWFVFLLCCVVICGILSILYCVSAILILAGTGIILLSPAITVVTPAESSGSYFFGDVMSAVFFAFIMAVVIFQMVMFLISKKEGTPFTRKNYISYLVSSILYFAGCIVLFIISLIVSVKIGGTGNSFASYILALPLSVMSAIIAAFIRYGVYLEEYKKDKDKYAKREEVSKDEKCV